MPMRLSFFSSPPVMVVIVRRDHACGHARERGHGRVRRAHVRGRAPCRSPRPVERTKRK